MTEDQIYSMLSDETLQKVADGGDLYESMSEDELQKVASFKDGSQLATDAPQGDGYGFSERQSDTIRVRGGRDPYAGQAYVEGLTPFMRGAEEGNERYEDQHLGAFLSTDKDNPYAFALRQYGEDQDPALKGYKAQTDPGYSGRTSRLLAQAPLGIGWLYRKAREADNPVKYATDYLIQQAWKAGFSDEELEQAKEISQGDPAKMYDFLAPRAAEKLKRYAGNRQESAERLAEHAEDESLGSKVAGGALGMIPMIEEFALGGAAGKAVTGVASLGKLNAIAKAAGTATWRGRLVNGLVHGLGTTATMGTEMTRRRYDALTADEYGLDEQGELVKKEGDDSATALKKAAIGGYGEAAIFSMPIGEAILGRLTPAITKALRTKVGAPVARMYENYVKYGQMTGLRGQPQMLALMDLNAFKDEVLGMNVKDADYEGFSAAWDKFRDETLSAKGQLDMFVSTLGVIAVQGGAALARARSAIAKERRSTDSVLQTYFGVPKENLDRMTPEHKAMWRELIMRRSLGTGDKNARGWAMDEAKLRKFCERLDAKFGEEAGSTMEKMGEYALKFDNSNGWENKGDLDGIRSNFSLPSRAVRDADGKLVGYDVPWEDAPVTLPDGAETQGQAFTDPNTGISVMRYMQTDRGGGDNGYVYLIRDGEGRRATRFGFKDALDAANDISRRQQKNKADRGGKLDALKRTYAELMLGESPLVVDTAEQAAEIKGAPLEPGEVAFTGGDGRQYYALDRFQTPEQMRKVVLHEVGRHRGIDLALPNPADKMGFLAGLAKSGDPVVQDQVRRIAEARMARGEIGSIEELFKRDNDGNYLHANALEEVWSHLFDHEGVPDAPGWWDAHMNAIRGNLRKVFHGLSYSRAEAEEMYRGAMEKLREQTGGEIEYVPDEPPTPPAPEPPSGKEAERLQSGVDAERAEGRASDFAAAEANLGEEIGAKHEAADRKRKARETTARRQQEVAAQKAQDEAYDEQERQRIERERQEEQDAQDDAELERMLAEDQRKNDMAEREDYQNRRREVAEQRARERAEAKKRADAEAVAAAQEREKQAQEREEQRRAGYEAADERARLDRRNAVRTAIREDDARRAEEYDRAEAERKRREAEDEAAGLPKIAVVESAPQGRGRTAPQNDVVRVNYGAEDGREGHPIVARRVTDGNGTVIGWDVNAVASDGTETLIASTTKPKKDGEAAIRAVRRQIHDHFGLPYGKAQKEAMEAERRRAEEVERKPKTGAEDETRDVRDEAPAKPEHERRDELPPEGEAARPEESGEAQGEELGQVVVHHVNEGREGEGVKAAQDALAGLFGDEGTEGRTDGAERAEARSDASGGESVDDAMAFLRSLPPDFKFFDEREELMSDERRDGNQRLVNLIGSLYDQKRIRGFGGFAKMVKDANPALWAEQKERLRGLWNYAAELSDGRIDRVGDYAARDAIRNADEGRNVRDVRGINALEAALQDIDVEMYPAAQLDRSDARVPNTKLAADPKSGIVPGHELKGRPRSLLSKPILGVEFEDGTVSVGTGRHRAELYSRYGMDIPMRRVREADGWVTKRPDGTYDFTKIRLLDALDNIQDSKGTIEDYVAFFRDVKIPRSEAESEGFLGSREARTAYALANDAIDDVRAAANFEGGRRAGYVSPEQAGAIADAAPKGAWEHNETVQRQLLKDVLKDRSMDATDIAVDAGLIAEDIRREINAGKVFQEDLFGNVIDAGAELREKKRDYIRDQISRYERLAKDIRAAKNSENGLTIKRADMRALGINEREIAKGGVDMRREYEKAAQKAALRAMEWRTGITSQLNQEDRAQMERDLGIAPAENRDAPASDRLPQASTEAPAPAPAADGSRVPAASTRETPPLVDQTSAVGDRDSALRGGRTGIVQELAGNFKRGDRVFLKGAAEGQRVTFVKANADGTADVQVRTPGANRYAPEKVETRTVPMGDISSTGMKDVLTEAERKRLADGITSQRFFNAAEEVTPERERDAAYRDWLKRYGMDDTEKHRREWELKHPATKVAERRISPAEDAAYMDAVRRGDMETAVDVDGFSPRIVEAIEAISDKEFRDVFRGSKSDFRSSGTAILFAKLDAGDRGAYDAKQNVIYINTGLRDNPSEIAKVLKHELVHVRQAREGEGAPAGFDPHAGDISALKYFVDPGELEARFAEEGRLSDFQQIKEELSSPLSDRLEDVEIGEMQITDWKKNVLSASGIRQLQQAARTDKIAANILKRSGIDKAENLLPAKVDELGERIMSDEESAHVGTAIGYHIMNPSAYKQQIIQNGRIRIEVMGRIDPSTGKRVKINPVSIARELSDRGIKASAVGPNEINIYATPETVEKLGELKKRIAMSLPENDAGNVIPLSQRFNPQNEDIRYFNIDEEAGRRVHAKDYDEALRMEGAGAGRREIWEKTGWWRGKDGKMRYEIEGISKADTKRMLDFALASGRFYDKDKPNTYTFTLRGLETAMKDKGERLPDSVKTLLAAYPKLGDVQIKVDRMAEQPKDGTLGYASPKEIHLYERGATAEVLNHELQHKIQHLSGMAGGTNTDGKSFDRYAHEHGEWEARQASTRADMDAEARGRTAPWETADEHGVAEDSTQIDERNRARVRPDGEPKEPEPVAPAADRQTGVGERLKTNLIDRLDPIRQMEITTGARDKKDLYREDSPYNAMRLLDGHNAAAKDRYEKAWKEPFKKMLRDSGVTADDVGMYLIAMNAKDRNRKVMDRSGVLDGAGLSDADAAKMLSDLRKHLGEAKMASVERMADFLWKMQREGMLRRVESGRVSKEMYEQWEREEPHHVPMRDDLSEDGEYNRSTRQWTRSDFHEAGGRYTLPDNPVEFMFREYQDAVYGSNINEARRVLADFVRRTPGIGKVRKGVRVGKGWSFTHNRLEDFPDPYYREQTVKNGPGRSNLVSFKEGGNLYMIELNGKQGERVAEAVIGRGVQHMFKPVAALTRAYASTATEYSPTFLGRNFAADMLEATLNTMADKGLIKGGAAAVRNVVTAVAAQRTIRRYLKTGEFRGKYAKELERYVKAGGLIGGMGNEGYSEIKKDLDKVAGGKRGVADVLKFVGRGISDFNKQAELATRLAVFKDYIDGGASDGEAAMRSREYSTDFNKYGNQRWMNSVWMFSGSVIGGAVRQTASLARGKAGKQLMAGLFAYGIVEALAEHFFNADDDDAAKKSGEASGATMTEYARANSLYFRIGGKYVRAPFHAGPFSVLKYAGNLVARAALGDVSWGEAAKRIAKEAGDTGMYFTGTGDFNSDTAIQSLAPTLLVPFIQAKSNEDFAGRPIERRMYSETKPYSENGRRQTGDIWKNAARGMNALTGGNEKRRGWFDYSPEMYKHWADTILKNMGRDITTVADFVTDIAEGKDIESRHVLYGGDYWRSVPDNTQNFYKAENAYKADRADGTIKQGSRRDETVKKLLREIETLRHWELGEEKKGNKWVPMRRKPSDATKEKHKKNRLRLQQRVIAAMGMDMK